jgi:hypothetical protein
MRDLVFVLLMGLALAMAVPGQKTASDPTKPVHDVFDRLVEGIKQADTSKVMSVYQKSDRILFFNNNGSATIGWDQMRQNRESLYPKTKNVSLEITIKDRNAREICGLCDLQMEAEPGIRRKTGKCIRPHDAGIRADRKGLEDCALTHIA